MSSRRQIRMSGGRFTSHAIRKPQRVSVVAPAPKPIAQPAPAETAPVQTAVKTRGGRVAIAKPAAAAPPPIQPIATPSVQLPAEMNHIDKTKSKARRTEVLKTINDALTGKLKAPRQRGGLLRVLS